MVRRGRHRALKIALSVVAGILLLLFAAAQIVLNSTFLTRHAAAIAAEYVDGDIHFGRIHASVFSSFPNLKLAVDDFSLTYPHGRFSAYDSLWIPHALRNAGRGELADTLASFRKLSLSLDYVGILKGKYRLHEVSIDGARFFAHNMDSTANWNLFRTGGGEDSGSSSIPHLILGKVSLTGSPLLVYTSPADTLFASVSLDGIHMGGRLDVTRLRDARLRLRADSLRVSGRTSSDTLSFTLNLLEVKDRKEAFSIHGNADAMLYSDVLGRINLPIDIKSELTFPGQDFKSFSLRSLEARAGMIDLSGEADVKMEDDSTYIRAEALVDSCPVKEMTQSFLSTAFPEVLKIDTDAAVDLTLLCDGWYVPSKGALPELIAQIVVPKSRLNYKDFPREGAIALEINASTDSYGKLSVSVDKLDAGIAGFSLEATGSAEDVLSEDPLILLDVKSSARLDTLGFLLPEGIRLGGDVDAAVSGMILLSDIDLYNFSRADLEGHISSSGISFSDAADSVEAYMGKTSIRLEKESGESFLAAGLLGLRGQSDSLYASIGKGTFVRGRGLHFSVQNAESTVSEEFGKEKHPVVGSLGAVSLAMANSDSIFVGARDLYNRFKLSGTEYEDKTVPILSLSSKASGMAMRQDVNRVYADTASVNLSSVMKGTRQSVLRRQLLDSLQKAHPGVQRDSLVRFLVRRGDVPDFLKEKSFRDRDIDIRLGESAAKYVRDWTIYGDMSMAGGGLITPYFPLKNTVEDFSASFDNDRVTVDSLTLRSGDSELGLSGSVSGLQRALTSRGVIDVKLKVASDSIDTDQLMAAYRSGTLFQKPEGVTALDESISDEQYMADVMEARQEDTDSSFSLIVIPANVNAELSLAGKGIKYSHLLVDWFASDIKMKQRTLQVTNTVASSNMGDIYLEGFYSTRTKSDISAGFDLNMVDITADKVITLFPAVDSIMPMLKSFKGMLDCEMAATSQLDTNMNLVTPSIKGVLQIGGRNLSVDEDGGLKKLAKILMFKDRKTGRIKDMSVRALISDSKLEIFPFVLGVDRYTLAMDGTQHFDQSFKYHFSVLQSPLPFRFGVNLSGNFDKWKYKIGKAKYKNENVPVFTEELDDMQVNLVTSIHNIFSKGAALALEDNAGAAATLDEARAKSGYDSEEGELEGEQLEEYNKMLESSENEDKQ